MRSADHLTGRTEKPWTIQAGSWDRGRKRPETNWRMMMTGVRIPEAAREEGQQRPMARPRAVQAPIVSTRVRAASPQEAARMGRLSPRTRPPTPMRTTMLSRDRTMLARHLAAT